MPVRKTSSFNSPVYDHCGPLELELGTHFTVLGLMCNGVFVIPRVKQFNLQCCQIIENRLNVQCNNTSLYSLKQFLVLFLRST